MFRQFSKFSIPSSKRGIPGIGKSQDECRISVSTRNHLLDSSTSLLLFSPFFLTVHIRVFNNYNSGFSTIIFLTVLVAFIDLPFYSMYFVLILGID